MSATTKRVLVIAHAHPDFQLGGGELAAYNLYKAYSQVSGVDACFIGRKITSGYPSGRINMRRKNDYTWEQSCAGLTMRSVNLDSTSYVFSDIVRRFNPSIIHFHHYVHIGVDCIIAVKTVAPSARILLTLHEYLAICHQQGQMFKLNKKQLCYQSSPEECASCIGTLSPEDIWLREHTFKSIFSFIDLFISPSEFLRQRYIEWGIPAERIVVIENGQSDEEKLAPRLLHKKETRNRFAFFGQCSPFKGIDVLLEALRLLPAEKRKQFVLEIHCASLDMQTPEFQERILALRKPLEKEGTVQWVGPYQPHELRKRMANVDWVVVPSIWWENSPMVIQEAFVHGRPLLVSDIGGMAEKVRDGIDGFHVQTANRLAWADALMRCATMTEEWEMLYANLPRPITYSECAERHFSVAPLNEV